MTENPPTRPSHDDGHAATRILIGTALALAAAARADAWRARPPRFVLTSSAGGLIDQAARALSDALFLELGQPLMSEPRLGGSGILAGKIASSAAPDGYTLPVSNGDVTHLPFFSQCRSGNTTFRNLQGCGHYILQWGFVVCAWLAC